MKMYYAIHKDLSLTAKRVDEIIIKGEDIPGYDIAVLSEGWVIVMSDGNL